jgi:hypothetical protein
LNWTSLLGGNFQLSTLQKIGEQGKCCTQNLVFRCLLRAAPLEIRVCLAECLSMSRHHALLRTRQPHQNGLFVDNIACYFLFGCRMFDHVVAFWQFLAHDDSGRYGDSRYHSVGHNFVPAVANEAK